MEVHHHPDVEKKGLKEYLLEGLMIFIAVMMGFFAESLREHISNGEKGHEFIVSLMADLKADTAGMNAYFIASSNRAADRKLLLKLLDQPIKDNAAFRGQFYRAAWSTLGTNHMSFADRIISQLKNSDNFRLITNHRIAEAIMEYGNGMADCEKQYEIVSYFTKECTKPALQMINLKAYGAHMIQNSSKLGDSTVAFRSTDPQVLQDYSNAVYQEIGVTRNYTLQIKDQKQSAIKLMELLKKEYDLD
jgi:hypothetical protein